MGQGGKPPLRSLPNSCPALHPPSWRVCSPCCSEEYSRTEKREAEASQLRGGAGAISQPSSGRKGLWGQVAATPHQEIQDHRFLPTSLNSGSSHPKLPNLTFVICEATYFLPFWRLCQRFPAPLYLCDPPTSLPKLYKSQIVKEMMGEDCFSWSWGGVFRFSHFDKPLNVFIVVFCIFL